jgi:hypothetical protein
MGQRWASFGWSRLLILAALAIMALAESQDATPSTYSYHNYGTINPRASVPGPMYTQATLLHESVSGWTVHPFAPLILLVLAGLFLSNKSLGPAWMRYRYWIAFAALAACQIPPYTDGNCFWISLPAFVLAILAAVTRKSVQPA